MSKYFLGPLCCRSMGHGGFISLIDSHRAGCACVALIVAEVTADEQLLGKQ